MKPEYVGKRVGFTGTSQGLTAAQEASLRALLKQLQPAEFHHGDCVGADGLAAIICNHLKPRPVIVCHPPTSRRKRAWITFNDFAHPMKGHFERNRCIVDGADLLVGCSAAPARQGEGGTWYTICCAEKRGKPRFVVWPDGTVSQPEDAIP